MKKQELKNIKVKPETKDKLDKIKVHPRQTYDELISNLVEGKSQ